MTVSARPSRSLAIGTAGALLIVCLDQLTKNWAISTLSPGSPKPVWWTLRWNLTFNAGMSFSKGQGLGPLLGVAAIIVALALLASLRKGAGRLLTSAVALIAGGALGNVLDRIFRGDGFLRGRVIDFIDVQWWPIWNVADMGVVIGAILMGSSMLIEHKRAAS
jgi:signal peptidase II